MDQTFKDNRNKYQEALEAFENLCFSCCAGYYEEILNLQKLVDKATPRKPIYEADGYSDGQLVYDTWICPNCDKDYEVDYDKYEYCPNCGQAIDWSE